MTVRKKRPLLLRQASAYFRIARKFEKAGQFKQAEHYHGIAERKVEQNRREQERRDRRKNDK